MTNEERKIMLQIEKDKALLLIILGILMIAEGATFLWAYLLVFLGA